MSMMRMNGDDDDDDVYKMARYSPCHRQYSVSAAVDEF